MIVRLVRTRIEPGHEGRVLDVIRELTERFGAIPGLRAAMFGRSVGDEGSWLLAITEWDDVDAIRAVQQRFCFFLVIGAPRSGGKYLTKELFRALGHVPSRIPAVLAHDGFPEAGPWRFSKAGTTWIESLHGMAEYLAMVEIFFAEAGRHRGRVIVAKKATKAVHAPGLFQSVLGEDAEGGDAPAAGLGEPPGLQGLHELG